jgi:ATP-dependent Clp protease adaptor protein ClpS
MSFFKTLEKNQVDTLEKEAFSSKLVIHNDDYNTFEWVAISLVEICNHTLVQAEQCAMIIHTKGKYSVKEGDYSTLKPLKEAIVERGINATID